jgi:phage terminase large subunit-like protein
MRARTRKTPDSVTKRWIRNAADELAVRNGCYFDEARARYVVDWIQEYCCLYEGDDAGKPLMLLDGALDETMRMFGWVKYSEDWGRVIRRFRRASIWKPKKNKKSPTLAAWGIYLFLGDGEPGQKIYSVAKDGQQAKISHTHAVEMIRRSPALDSECKINQSTLQIFHPSTSSFYKIVAGDNIRSQEGLNGSLLVDETHVVDRRLMRVLRGAGISRSEPLHIEVSTAGNNPDGYGKERWDYGIEVEKGIREDEQLLFISYHAPQDLSDADLDADPLKWGKIANPAWGHTIKPAEFLAEYNASKSSPNDLLEFKMYRLNIWQRSAAPWIREGDWTRCKHPLELDFLKGRICAAGLDLSKKRDMSALGLVFPMDDPETYYLLPFFWMPESEAQGKNHLAPFMTWSKQGFLTLTPGDVIDYGFIGSQFRQLARLYRIKELAFDQHFAEDLTQRLEQGAMDDKGNVIEEGTGVTRYAFNQTLGEYAGATEDFERAILSGRLWHPDHPVLTWQAGHVKIRQNSLGYKMPVKPAPGDIKKIDGIQACVMGLARAVKLERNDEWYRPGILRG